MGLRSRRYCDHDGSTIRYDMVSMAPMAYATIRITTLKLLLCGETWERERTMTSLLSNVALSTQRPLSGRNFRTRSRASCVLELENTAPLGERGGWRTYCCHRRGWGVAYALFVYALHAATWAQGGKSKGLTWADDFSR